MQEIGRALVAFGVIAVAVGVFLIFMHKIPLVGKLPGDIYIHKKNFTFYFPLATSLLASVILSVIFWLWSRR